MDSSSSSSRHRPRSDSQLLASTASATVRPTSLPQHNSATTAQSDSPTDDDHFDTLSRPPSRRSRISTFSFSRPGSVTASDDGAHRDRSRKPSIRIRRSSVGLTGGQQTQDAAAAASLHPESQCQNGQESCQGGRPRSTSQPVLAGDSGSRTRNSWRVQLQGALPRLTEEGSRPTMAELGLGGTSAASASRGATLERSHSAGELDVEDGDNRKQRRSFVDRLFRPSLKRSSGAAQPQTAKEAAEARCTDEYNEELVDWLDIIDPEVQTLSTLTNVQNSLFVPDLGSWVNRRPTYVLSQPDMVVPRPVSRREAVPPPEESTIQEEEVEEGDRPFPDEQDIADNQQRVRRSNTITSRLSDSHYAALPHGETLEGWSAAEKWELDDHVRHMLHSRRSKFKRQMRGFGQYVRRPLGFFVTLYATLITLFGLAWVLFLIGWIYVGDQQVYAIHIIDSVLVALFAIMGDGLAPFRAMDTYHMIFIARYARIIAKAREKANRAGLSQSESRDNIQNAYSPAVEKAGKTKTTKGRPIATNPIPSITIGHTDDDHNHHGRHNKNNNNNNDNNNNDDDDDDDDEGEYMNIDLEEDAQSSTSASSLEKDCLTAKQRKSLAHHQTKLAKSHSFYKPHETFTHHAFPLAHLIAIIVLLDCHSCLQISLGATTWGIDYHHRHFAITTSILCVSITCNLTAGLVIMFGDRKTRKKDVVELLNRQALTGDAMKKVAKKRNRGLGLESDGEGILTGQSSHSN